MSVLRSRLFFKSVQEQSTPTTLLDFVSEIEGFSDTDIVIAKDDLNNDHIYEYIIRNTRCTPAEGCPYLIIADSDENYVVIGEFSGKNISISDKQTHGIRDILVYNQSLNDYAHNTLKWDMERMHYKFNQKQGR